MKRPRTPTDWDERYQEGDLPWDSGRPDEHLVRLVGDHPIPPGRVLEVGCGTGTNAIWLAQQGFDVVATDFSATALEAARAKAAEAGATVVFLEGSFPEEQAPFDLVFDRGCFHCLENHAARTDFATSAAARLTPAGLWLSLIGSTDGPPRDHGPPRISATAVVSALETRFEILSLEDVLFDSKLPSPARMWACVARRRAVYPDPSEDQ